MKLFDSVCNAATRVLGLLTLSPWTSDIPQQPITPSLASQTFAAPHHVQTLFPNKNGAKKDYKGAGRGIDLNFENLPGSTPQPELHRPGPVFAPPNAPEGFACNYSAMRGWRHVAGGGGGTNWLEKEIGEDDDTGGIYNIFTNYDQYAPIGIVRKYHLNVTDQHINADGINRIEGGKVFNGQYPGPWIQACWGDWVEITVENHLKYNGTAIHMHGVRMLNSFENDGVNAITQCAIAPGDSYTYKFRVTQYGTSWYHSHYSLQYADGLAGPITFHGPHATDYDVALEPWLFGDWSHNSAFQDYFYELHKPPASMQSIILNGRGFYNCTNNPNVDCQHKISPAPALFEQIFDRGRRYLLRLINTSTASTFIFSIDKHILQVIAMDFVAINPYYADSILVGIGQRYHAVVMARPADELIPPEDQNYWIRIKGATGCADFEPGQADERMGIVRYDSFTKKKPTTLPYKFDTTCSDEPYESLVPVVPMQVTAGPHPANDVSPDTGDNFEIGIEVGSAQHTVPHGNFTRWNMLNATMWLNLTDPTIDHIGDYSWGTDEAAIVIEDHSEDEWIYLIMSGQGTPKSKTSGRFAYIPVAHPMHLHGHDFVLLAQENRPFDMSHLTDGTFKYDNPPRRDVALLPRNGYMAIGFRADNPGQWILHCHIAWHASSGLGIQIRENERHIDLSPEVIAEKDRVCKNWREWHANSKNWWDEEEFQEDSGV